jgi:fructose-specific phosphotransferase system IIC component
MPEPPRHAPPSIGRLVLPLIVFAVLGMPLVAWVWEEINRLLSGHVEGRPIVLGIVAAAVLAALLFWLARTVERWSAERPS